MNKASDDLDAKMYAIPGLAAATVGAILAARGMNSSPNTEDVNEFPLYKTIRSLSEKHSTQGKISKREILVIHSHSHSDHYGADSQFTGQENVTVVAANSSGINKFFDFKEWPNKQTKLELGGRSIIIIPTPGHQEEAISIYDMQTK